MIILSYDIAEWLEKKADKYTSPDIQNELLKLMSHAILRVVAGRLQQADFFTIMADECVDGANKEQLALCFRYVDEDVRVHEEFILGCINAQISLQIQLCQSFKTHY